MNVAFISIDGYFIDDPLYVVNVKPDFSDLGLQPDFSSNNSDFVDYGDSF